MCGRIIDTKLEYSTKPALNFAQIALEKEKAKQKKRAKRSPEFRIQRRVS